MLVRTWLSTIRTPASRLAPRRLHLQLRLLPPRLPQNSTRQRPRYTPASTSTLIPTATPTACGLGWHDVSIPSPGTLYNELVRVSAISPDDIWAVGYQTSTPGVPASATLHWDGISWQVVPSPSPSNFVVLQGVAGSRPMMCGPSATARTSHWPCIGMALSGLLFDLHPPASPTSLTGVSALGSNDVWAVGDANGQTLVIHWDGTQWNIVPSPSVPNVHNFLYTIDAISDDDIWASGYTYIGSPENSNMQLVMHWDGSQWASLTASAACSGRADLVSAYSASDVWVAGKNNSYPAIYHWDGATWSSVTVPDPGGIERSFEAVVAVGPDDAWTMGNDQSSGGPPLTVAMRCNCRGV